VKEAGREAYRRFVKETADTSDGYLFDSPRCRFQPEPADELVLAKGATVAQQPGGARVHLPGGGQLWFPGVAAESLTAAFRALPTSYARFSIQLGAQAPAVIEQAFSRILFAPTAVLSLERELPSLEIVRFPGSPYEIVRPYWRNMLAVRRALQDRSPPTRPGDLRTLLLELHELALMGEADEGRASYYLPASLLGRKRATPGQLYEEPSSVEYRGSEWIVTSGARVSVPLLGGEHYWRLLAESVSDEAALEPERHVELDGLSFGRVLQARGEMEQRALPWFLPPRPLEARHFEALLSPLLRADSAQAQGNRDQLIAALAAFHYRFVRIHPLPSANQSLSMSIVNSRLNRMVGVGIPHLLLDQLALRFGPEAYMRLFARAARFWNAPWPNAADRLQQLMMMRTELNAFVSELSGLPSLVQARGLAAEPGRKLARELALLSDG